ncbi:SDR family NAD(P)-dependent oxidoreductase [Sphingobium sp. MI1205]|uniref:SDR family NAD(P)-dependent oxidoreductase n=1 Tax=Sphingobium sp. MI1205 TaxID=407020 RepID=UPI0009F9A724|nr:SDR family oxidoreductase [Sphingobium sp. MI1205]
MFYAMDVSDSASVVATSNAIEAEIGPVHGLVVNAAYAFFSPSIAHNEEEWRRVIDVNLNGAFLCVRAFGQPMLERGGSVVLISSIAARTSVGPHLAYSASKVALSHMAAVLGVEWAEHGVRVNALEPGYTATSAIEHLKEDAPEVASSIENTIPIKRFLRPDEIASPTCFLLSDWASGMTGSVVIADGGMSAK